MRNLKPNVTTYTLFERLVASPGYRKYSLEHSVNLFMDWVSIIQQYRNDNLTAIIDRYSITKGFQCGTESLEKAAYTPIYKTCWPK